MTRIFADQTSAFQSRQALFPIRGHPCNPRFIDGTSSRVAVTTREFTWFNFYHIELKSSVSSESLISRGLPDKLFPCDPTTSAGICSRFTPS